MIARRQVLAAGGDDLLVARLLRRRTWARVHDGVYVEHTGPLSRRQREWAALLLYAPAVLAGRSALAAHGVTTEVPRDVELAIAHGRRVEEPTGVRTTQLRDFDQVAVLTASPPRLRLEVAALMAASRSPREDSAVAVLADCVRDGHTTTGRLSAELDRLTRLPRRALLRAALTDVGLGAQSPLEWRYLRDVERAHGLPRGDRQVREVVRRVAGELLTAVYRDVRYRGLATLVELDGVLGHTASLDRWADLQRDLVAAVAGDITLRAGWQQVLEPCRLAGVVGAVLIARGWEGTVTPCNRPGCRAGAESAA